jgi:ubiquinone/menaquinone biosynthesis C-methylase UbiE
MDERTEYEPGLFASTAPYYSRFRPPYRESMFAVLRKTFELEGRGRLLDLGCGPGSVAIPLAPMFKSVLAVDPDDDMRAEGARVARERGVTNIEWRIGGSNDLSPALGSFRLVTIGNAFHWMDRDRTLEELYPLVADDGGIAIVGYGFPFPEDVPVEPWREVVAQIIHKHITGSTFRGFDMPVPVEVRHDTFLGRSRFKRLTRWQERYEQRWTIDELVGNLYSTSFCNHRLLGDHAAEFERELRAAMRAISPSGVLREPHETYAVMAWKR